jgi:ferritin
MLNDQINHEHTNEIKYRNVQAYFSNLNMLGFAVYFAKQAEGEYEHYKTIQEYLDSKNALYQLNSDAYTNQQFKDIPSILDFYYNTELETTQKLYAIVKQAKAEGDEGTIQWLYRENSKKQVGLIAEQIEEENSALTLKSRVMAGVGDNEQLNNQWYWQIDNLLKG